MINLFLEYSETLVLLLIPCNNQKVEALCGPEYLSMTVGMFCSIWKLCTPERKNIWYSLEYYKF